MSALLTYFKSELNVYFQKPNTLDQTLYFKVKHWNILKNSFTCTSLNQILIENIRQEGRECQSPSTEKDM